MSKPTTLTQLQTSMEKVKSYVDSQSNANVMKTTTELISPASNDNFAISFKNDTAADFTTVNGTRTYWGQTSGAVFTIDDLTDYDELEVVTAVSESGTWIFTRTYRFSMKDLIAKAPTGTKYYPAIWTDDYLSHDDVTTSKIYFSMGLSADNKLAFGGWQIGSKWSNGGIWKVRGVKYINSYVARNETVLVPAGGDLNSGVAADFKSGTQTAESVVDSFYSYWGKTAGTIVTIDDLQDYDALELYCWAGDGTGTWMMDPITVPMNELTITANASDTYYPIVHVTDMVALNTTSSTTMSGGKFHFDVGLTADNKLGFGGWELGTSFTEGGVWYIKGIKYQDINRTVDYPHKWEVGKEIDLGNGLYGFRLGDAFSTAYSGPVSFNTTIMTGASNYKVVDSGGWVQIRNTAGSLTQRALGSTFFSDTVAMISSTGVMTTAQGQLVFRTSLGSGSSIQAGDAFDVWVTYTKS